jgi:hypothetical protein
MLSKTVPDYMHSSWQFVGLIKHFVIYLRWRVVSTLPNLQDTEACQVVPRNIVLVTRLTPPSHHEVSLWTEYKERTITCLHYCFRYVRKLGMHALYITYIRVLKRTPFLYGLNGLTVSITLTAVRKRFKSRNLNCIAVLLLMFTAYILLI